MLEEVLISEDGVGAKDGWALEVDVLSFAPNVKIADGYLDILHLNLQEVSVVCPRLLLL